MENYVCRVDDVVWRKIGDEIVVITDDGRSVHVLNKTAAHVWEMCNGEARVDTIADSLCERFEVTQGEAKADVRTILEKLETLGLLQKNVEESGR